MNVQFEHATPEELVVLHDSHVWPQAGITASNVQRQADDLPRILAELVIEEVSIDGMCGVY